MLLIMEKPSTREQAITELLKKFQRRFRPIYISLVTAASFLDFSEEEWLRLKDVMVRSFEVMSYDVFIERYFPESSSIEFELKCNDNVCTLVWWIPSATNNGTYFQRPGAAMIREMGDYWIFMLFYNDTGDKKTYEAEMNTLGNLIEQLEEKIS